MSAQPSFEVSTPDKGADLVVNQAAPNVLDTEHTASVTHIHTRRAAIGQVAVLEPGSGYAHWSDSELDKLF